MNRLLLEPHEIDGEGRATLSDRRAVHIRQVLRGRPGMRLRAGLVGGPAGEAEILDLAPSSVTLCFAPSSDAAPLPATTLPVDLLLALPRPKVLKRLWPQLSALGLRRIMVTHAERVERCYFSSHWLAPTRVRPLLIEGAVQAGMTRLPSVDIFRYLDDALGADATDDPPGLSRWLGLPAAAATPLPAPPRTGSRGVRVAVGPEGGWTPVERERLATARYLPVCLGPHTLRSDTACIALLGLARHWTQDYETDQT